MIHGFLLYSVSDRKREPRIPKHSGLITGECGKPVYTETINNRDRAAEKNPSADSKAMHGSHFFLSSLDLS